MSKLQVGQSSSHDGAPGDRAALNEPQTRSSTGPVTGHRWREWRQPGQRHPFAIGVESATARRSMTTQGSLVQKPLIPIKTSVVIIAMVAAVLGLLVIPLASPAAAVSTSNNLTATSNGDPPESLADPASRASQFAADWVNNDPNTRGISRLGITVADQAITVHGYGNCIPECDWNTVTVTYSGEPVVVLFDFGKGDTTKLSMTLDPAGNALTVAEHGSSGPDMTDTFHRGSFHPAAQFAADWVNNDPNTRGISRLGITVADQAITVHGYGNCVPTECDWNTRTVTYSGAPVVVLFDNGNGLTHKLSMTLDAAGKSLTVIDQGSASGTHTDFFHH
jgi:hypothetical protein